MTTPLPEYERPPLNEVAIGVQFEPVAKLGAAHFGVYWNQIRERYPDAQSHPPILHLVERFNEEFEVQAKASVLEFVGLPTPRCWFLQKNGQELIQLQPDRFHRNWRQVEGNEEYPRFEVLFDKFKTEWQSFTEFLDKETMGSPLIDQCELTYINHILKGDAWNSLSEIPKVFSWAGRRRDGFLPPAKAVSWRSSYGLPQERGRLHAEVKFAIRNRDRKELLVLELTVRGAPAGRSLDEMNSWFGLAHEWIVRAFTDLTTEEMHQLWKRKR